MSKPDPVRRYVLNDATDPPNGRATPPRVRNRNAFVSVGAVQDPGHNPTGHGRILATIHHAGDILNNELAHGRINDAAHAAGKRLQRAFEHVPGIQGCNWRGDSRVDHATAQGLAWERYERAKRKVDAIRSEAVRVIGESGFVFMARILRDGWTFAEYAANTGKGTRGASAVADRFRTHLADLADGWAAKGRELR